MQQPFDPTVYCTGNGSEGAPFRAADGTAGIHEAYATGKGKIIVRGKAEIERSKCAGQEVAPRIAPHLRYPSAEQRCRYA